MLGLKRSSSRILSNLMFIRCTTLTSKFNMPSLADFYGLVNIPYLRIYPYINPSSNESCTKVCLNINELYQKFSNNLRTSVILLKWAMWSTDLLFMTVIIKILLICFTVCAWKRQGIMDEKISCQSIPLYLQ